MPAETRLPFTKMEGLGNDYVYFEESRLPLKNLAELARRVSDRHFGVGGDGLVLIGRSAKADFSMRMFNVDGSEAEMCGNATRCVGKYVYDRGLTQKTSLTLETLAGIRKLDLRLSEGRVISASVDMGEPILEPARIPVNDPGKDFIDREITVGGAKYRATAVSMGNPHVVIPVGDVDALDLPSIGPLFENHALFPKRINTEFVQIVSRTEVRMRTWERGSGETLACGTGTCACAVACALNGFTDRSVTVHLTGGDLLIDWDSNNRVHMTGTATQVFDGEYLVPAGLSLD
ncbi:MAG: diaminopimelate epimerase [Deltaproteobacteria bacterium]|jgi:diaminopimelate epimerase|nr:diaminopimelate epimerase [Deltaproteobacteria bacterium]